VKVVVGITMKTKMERLFIIMVSLPLMACGQTNGLWFKSFSFPRTNEIRLSEACEIIERDSAKLDESGQGLKVLFPPDFTNQTFNIGPEPLSFAEALNFCGRAEGNTFYKIFDRTGVIGYRGFTYTLLALAGKCTDAVTGGPITNFAVNASNELDTQYLMIDVNGSFMCAIPHQFNYMYTPSAIIEIQEGTSPDEQILHFSAPGYETVTVSNSIYWSHSWGNRYVEVKMNPSAVRPKEANKTSQIVVAPAPTSER